MNKQNFIKYAEVKKEIARLTNDAKDLELLLRKEVEEAGADKVEVAEVGSFSLVSRKTWKYSEEVEKREKIIKTLKQAEEVNGDATFTETKSLRFTPTKNEPRETE